MSKDLFHYTLLGQVEDGRKWWLTGTFTVELMNHGGLFRIIQMLAFTVKSWDEDHQCKTVRFTLARA